MVKTKIHSWFDYIIPLINLQFLTLQKHLLSTVLEVTYSLAVMIDLISLHAHTPREQVLRRIAVSNGGVRDKTFTHNTEIHVLHEIKI